jgi:hypothetical protein
VGSSGVLSAQRFQLDVAREALGALRDHGFALAGGLALRVHGIVDRPFGDVDLFTDAPAGDALEAAARLLQGALAARRPDWAVRPVAQASELFDGFGRDLAEVEVRHGRERASVRLVRYERRHAPVAMIVGPVLHLDDVLGGKVAAMAVRGEPRDYIDVAAALDHYGRDELLTLARRSEPALTDDEFRDAMLRFDRISNEIFADSYRRTPLQIARMRKRFRDWPRRRPSATG